MSARTRRTAHADFYVREYRATHAAAADLLRALVAEAKGRGAPEAEAERIGESAALELGVVLDAHVRRARKWESGATRSEPPIGTDGDFEKALRHAAERLLEAAEDAPERWEH